MAKPPVPVRPFGGRPSVPNRAALGGILFVLKTGTATRAKKFLTCSFAPDPALARPQQASSFLSAFARCPDVQTVP